MLVGEGIRKVEENEGRGALDDFDEFQISLYGTLM
jgi:hypothetical protein